MTQKLRKIQRFEIIAITLEMLKEEEEGVEEEEEEEEECKQKPKITCTHIHIRTATTTTTTKTGGRTAPEDRQWGQRSEPQPAMVT